MDEIIEINEGNQGLYFGPELIRPEFRAKDSELKYWLSIDEYPSTYLDFMLTSEKEIERDGGVPTSKQARRIRAYAGVSGDTLTKLEDIKNQRLKGEYLEGIHTLPSKFKTYLDVLEQLDSNKQIIKLLDSRLLQLIKFSSDTIIISHGQPLELVENNESIYEWSWQPATQGQ